MTWVNNERWATFYPWLTHITAIFTHREPTSDPNLNPRHTESLRVRKVHGVPWAKCGIGRRRIRRAADLESDATVGGHFLAKRSEEGHLVNQHRLYLKI